MRAWWKLAPRVAAPLRAGQGKGKIATRDRLDALADMLMPQVAACTRHAPSIRHPTVARIGVVKIYRTVLFDHVIETRVGELGGERVLVDGRLVSEKLFAVLMGASHHFELDDADGRTHQIEVHRRDQSRLGLGRYRVLVSVDGVERCQMDVIDPRQPITKCRHCGYSLEGQPTDNGEIRCPECGRHTPAAALGRG